MARVKFGAPISVITGKFNGSYFQKGYYGQQIGRKVNQLFSRTPPQSKIRQNFSVLSKKWGQLTEAQRQQWRNAAPSQNEGYNYFQSRNLPVVNSGGNFFPSPPADLPLPNLDFFEYLTGWSGSPPHGSVTIIWDVSKDFKSHDLITSAKVALTKSAGATPQASEAIGGYYAPYIWDNNTFQVEVLETPIPGSNVTLPPWRNYARLKIWLDVYYLDTGQLAQHITTKTFEIPLT